ncbi:MAG: transporter permease [Candidatus Saccharibacteria bacterium]|nr:transporter permease [Candidatus Saccharibacteria bacterium]
MAKRSLRHTIRSMDTIITVAAMPIAMMLLFVYVFGSSFDTGSIKYINFVTPGIVVMCILSGIAYAALRLNNDMTNGIINRFKTMPIASSSILGGHAVSSVLSNLFSVCLVLIVAFLVGFRSDAGIAEWTIFSGLLLLFTIATTWLAIVFGLLAKTAEGAGAFSYILLLLVFVSSAFTPTDKMTPWLRAFAEHQPMTPIIETMRSLLVNGTAGESVWIAIAWCAGLLVVSYVIALRIYKNKTT